MASFSRSSLSNYRVILVGDVGVGKTSLLCQFTESKFVINMPNTVGVEFGTRIIDFPFHDHQCIDAKLQIWDLSGRERFRQLTRCYYDDADAAIIVFDLTRRSTFDHLPTWIREVRDLLNDDALVFVVGNKTDNDVNRTIERHEIEAFLEKTDLPYLETTARSYNDVERVFRMVASAVHHGPRQHVPGARFRLASTASLVSDIPLTPQAKQNRSRSRLPSCFNGLNCFKFSR